MIITSFKNVGMTLWQTAVSMFAREVEAPAETSVFFFLSKWKCRSGNVEVDVGFGGSLNLPVLSARNDFNMV